MKKHVFDVGMYLDALKQLRYIGLSGMLLLCLEAVLVPIGYLISLRHLDTTHLPLQTVDALEMHPLLMVCFLLLAPLMMLYLFQFLNKRPACDFYHAIPNSRVSLFLSFFAAVMTWLVAIAVFSTALSLAFFSLLHDYLSFSLAGILVMLFNTLAACLFVSSVFAIGMCVTGTLFTNVTVSLLLLFMPRLLLLVFRTTLANLLPVVSAIHFIPPLDDPYNVVTNLVCGMFGGDPSLSFTFLPGGVYTLCLGALYTGLACWLFHKRRSETAGKAAPNRAVQTLYRLLIAMLICLFPCVMIVDALLGNYTMSSDDFFLILVFYLAAAFVYFLYELFTTRKWRNLLRSIPALGILVLMNGLFIGGVTAAYYSTLGIQPQAEDIKAVRFIDKNDHEYFSARTATVRHEDPALFEVVADRLEYTLDLVRRSPSLYYAQENDNAVVSQQVAIYLHGRTIYRNVLLTPQDVNTIAQIFGQNPTYQDAYLRLPETPSVSVDELTNAQATALYNTLREEVATLSFADWYGHLQQRYQGDTHYTGDSAFPYGYSDQSLATLHFSSTIGTQWYSSSIPLDALLPRTCNLYMQFINENTAASFDVLAALQESNWQSSDWLTIRLIHTADSGGDKQLYSRERNYSGDILQLLHEPLTELASQLESHRAEAPDITQPLYCFLLDRGEMGAGTLYINIQGASVPEFLRQYSETD